MDAALQNGGANVCIGVFKVYSLFSVYESETGTH